MGRSRKRSGRRGEGSYRKRQQARALSCSTTISYVGAKTLVSSLPALDNDVISKLEDRLNRREAFEEAADLRDTAKSGALLVQRHLWFGKWAFLGIKMGKVRICKCEGGNAPHSALLPRADGCMPREAPQRPAAAIFAVQMQAHLQIRAAHLQMRPAHHSAFVNARVHSLIL